MRIVAIKTLSEFWSQHTDAKSALESWYAEARDASWRGPQDILDHYGTADVLPDNRVVFNIKGNRYRLVVKIHYNTGIVYIRFIGTHAEYNRIDAETI
jgi:mRNA interferase HigB